MKLETNSIKSGLRNYLPDKKLLSILVLGLIIEILCLGITYLGDIKKNIPVFTFLYTGSFIAYCFAIFNLFGKGLSPNTCHKNIDRGGDFDKNSTLCNSNKIFWVIIVFSIVFRFTLLPVVPSDDIFRYLWEGKLQLNLINPYTYAPDSAELEHLHDKFHPYINHKNLSTIYPPFTLMMFAFADFISHSLTFMKFIFVSFDLLIILILSKFLKKLGQNPLAIMIYAWSPLVLVSFAARGHCDSLQIFFVILALYLYSTQRRAISVVAVGLAIISKFITVIVAPFFILKNKRRYVVVLMLTVVVFYIPYMSAGGGLFSTLIHFGLEYHFNDSIHFLILCLSYGSANISKVLTIILFGSSLLYLYKRFYDKSSSYNQSPKLNSHSNTLNHNKDLYEDILIMRYTFYTIGVFLMFSPTVHPWYLTWIIPFLCFFHSKAWLVLTGTVVFYYYMNHHLFSTIIQYNNEYVWQEVHWLKLPEYLPFFALLIYDFLKNRRKRLQGEK